jgi:hypothetical protein
MTELQTARNTKTSSFHFTQLCQDFKNVLNKITTDTVFTFEMNELVKKC